jgi:hypothetical protein
MKWMFSFALAACLLTGCTINGNKYYPVIGLGWVKVPTNSVNATIVKTTVVGAGVSTFQPSATVGFSATTIALVHTNSNVLLEIK